MAASKLANSVFFLLFFLSVLVLSNSNTLTSTNNPMVPAIYVFGDSLVDVGNNNYLPVSLVKADFPPNGVDFPTKKPTGRFSNGINAADLLAERVGLQSPPPYLGLLKNKSDSFNAGVSFASAGAKIFNDSYETIGQIICLTDQVGDYISVYRTLAGKFGETGMEQHLGRSLFLIWIGSNDLDRYFRVPDPSHVTPHQYVNLMLHSLLQQLKRLYTYGGRKFVVLGLSMLGCTPAKRMMRNPTTQECYKELNFWARQYNAGLKEMLQQLKMELSGFSYSYIDTFSIMENILQSPSNYGFKEVKAACCGLGELRATIPCLPISEYCSNRTDHLFWDLHHPTEATDRILVNDFFDGSSQYTQPINVRQLIASIC